MSRDGEGGTHVVVGATGAVGSAVCQRLTEAVSPPERVLGLSRRVPPATHGDQFVHVRFDLVQPADQAGLGDALGAFGVDGIRSVVFAQAAPLDPTPLVKQRMDQLARQHALYVEGPLRLLQTLFPGLRKSSSAIVFIGTEALQKSPSQWGAYLLAKAAQSQLVKLLQVEWGRLGIGVAEVQAGLMKSAMTANLPSRLFELVAEEGGLDDADRVASEVVRLIDRILGRSGERRQ